MQGDLKGLFTSPPKNIKMKKLTQNDLALFKMDFFASLSKELKAFLNSFTKKTEVKLKPTNLIVFSFRADTIHENVEKLVLFQKELPRDEPIMARSEYSIEVKKVKYPGIVDPKINFFKQKNQYIIRVDGTRKVRYKRIEKFKKEMAEDGWIILQEITVPKRDRIRKK